MLAFLRWITSPVWLLLSSRARSARQATLLRTLAVAVDRQISLVPFLQALAEESAGGWRIKVRGLADLLGAGVSIPDALDAVPGILPADTLVMIRVGSEAGRLGPALRDAAAQLIARSGAVRPPSGAGIIYLCALLFVMLNVVGFIMYYIIPKFREIFNGFGMELPELTKAIIGFSGFGARYLLFAAPFALLLLAVGMTVAFELVCSAAGWSGPRRWLTRAFPRLHAPLVLRSLSLAVDGGRPLGAALATLAARHPDRALRRRVVEVEDAVAGGMDCWRSLQSVGLLRRGETALLEAAQRVGNLSWALRGVADSIERRAEHRMRIALEFLRPVGLLAAGTAVGFFVVGLFLPVVKVITEMPIEGGGR